MQVSVYIFIVGIFSYLYECNNMPEENKICLVTYMNMNLYTIYQCQTQNMIHDVKRIEMVY